MARHPVKQSFFKRTVAMAKRNPLKAAAIIIGVFGGIPTAVAGYEIVANVVDPVVPAFHYWVRYQTSPLMKLTEEHSVAIDYLILKDQRQAIKDAKADQARDPHNTSAAKVIDNLQKSIDVRQRRLDDATKK